MRSAAGRVAYGSSDECPDHNNRCSRPRRLVETNDFLCSGGVCNSCACLSLKSSIDALKRFSVLLQTVPIITIITASPRSKNESNTLAFSLKVI